jgi:hypothetical protein
LARLSAVLVRQEAFAELLAAQPATPPAGVRIEKDSTVVITFTSGSTGLPKGVMGRHSSLTWYYPWMGETFGLAESDRCGGVAPCELTAPPRKSPWGSPALIAPALALAPMDRRMREPSIHERSHSVMGGHPRRFSMCSGIAHDPLQRDIFTPLFFGAAVCADSAFGRAWLVAHAARQPRCDEGRQTPVARVPPQVRSDAR